MALSTGPDDLPPQAPSALGSWEEWGRYMLEEVRSLRREVQQLNEKNEKTRIDLAVLKAKAAFYGTVAGIVAAGVIQWVASVFKAK